MSLKTNSVMSYYLVRMLLIATVFVGCSVFFGCSGVLKMEGDPIKVAGTVDTTSVGIMEVPIHSTFILRNCWWIQQQKGTAVALYFEGPLEPWYIGKRLSINGKVYSSFFGSRVRYFIHVYDMKVLQE